MTETATGAGRRRGRPPKAEAGDTKDALLQAALGLFAEKGYEGTSVRAIAREVGLSESVLYAHFDSKRAIFDAVLAELGAASAVAVLKLSTRRWLTIHRPSSGPWSLGSWTNGPHPSHGS